jgi:uncharacterized membrane protein
MFKAKNVAMALIASGFALVAAPSFAAAQAAEDVTDLVTGISNQVTPVTTVAAAVLGLHLVVKCYKWIRRAMS